MAITSSQLRRGRAQSEGVGQLVNRGQRQPSFLLQETLDGVHRDPRLLGRGVSRQPSFDDRVPQSLAHGPFLVASGLFVTHYVFPLEIRPALVERMRASTESKLYASWRVIQVAYTANGVGRLTWRKWAGRMALRRTKGIERGRRGPSGCGRVRGRGRTDCRGEARAAMLWDPGWGDGSQERVRAARRAAVLADAPRLATGAGVAEWQTLRT